MSPRLFTRDDCDDHEKPAMSSAPSSHPKPKIVVLEPEHFSERAREILLSRYSVEDYSGTPIADAEVLLGGLEYRMDESFLQGFSSLKAVCTVTTGRNHVDLGYLQQRHLRLISLHDIRDQIMTVSSTAELALALILNVGRRISQSSRAVAVDGRWSRMDFFTSELRGQTLGVIGFGRIGQMVASMAQGLGLKVLAYDPEVTVPEGSRAQSLQEVVGSSDVISLHADFRGSVLLGRKELELCKKGAAIVNTARGELVDEVAIGDALTRGTLSGYAADVLTGENTQNWDVTSDPLVRMSREGLNVILSPHLGGCTREAFEATQVAMSRHATTIELD